MVIAYYMIFLIPTLILVFYFFKVIVADEILEMYKNVLFHYRFELFASTSITTLFIVLYKTSRILKVRNEELEKALIKSEKSDRLKTAFLNNINHEIRTPLNGIVGFASLIVQPDMSDDQRKSYSSMIHSSSDQLLSTMSNIIDISKIKAGQIDVYYDRISIKELLDNIYIKYLFRAQSKNLNFEIIQEEPDSIDIIFSDKRMLTQIIENLLNNAFKFTEKGSVRISYKTKNNFIYFYVEDTGSGIAGRLHEQIFDHFSKFEKEEDKFYEGVGLGLTIAKALVELLNGSIQVSSEIGKGSLFSFTIPVNPNIHP
jgi:signal transduction histidine kinase